jgi:hypothetical protein
MRTSEIAAILEHPGPYASATIDVSRDDEAGAHEHELRVREVAERLRASGADEQTITALAERLGERVTEPAPVARVAVASAGEVLFDTIIYTRVDASQVAWGPLPELSAYLTYQDAAAPFVLALVDHEGGDVARYHAFVPEPDEQVSAGGETEHAHKVPGGGWSSLRYMHESENVWKRNAEAVAEEIERSIRAGWRLVLLAGDPHSRSSVVKRLEDTPAEVVVLDTGGRTEDGGDDALTQAIREALLEYTVARRLQSVHRLKDGLGQEGAVATGVRDIATALVRGQVETLLIDLQATGEHTLRLDEHPGLVLGSAPADQPLRADLALVAGAAMTGADVEVVRQAAMGGAAVAALLRWNQLSEGA